MAVTREKFEELYQRALAAAGGPEARDFDSALKLFHEWAEGLYYLHYLKTNPTMMENGTLNPKLTLEKGPRYVRVVAESTGPLSRSAWAFVDKTTGNILKPAGWKAPAKGARGSIYEPTKWSGWISPYGPAYLK